jgi:hypothetical protein
MSSENPLDPFMKIALSMANRHFEYYSRTATQVENPKIKALLLVLAETEEDLLEKIRHMMATGILDEIEEMGGVEVGDDPPDGSPISPERIDTDPRIFVCNKALEQEVKGYTFYLSMAARAKSELISRLFEYLAFIKSQQIDKIRSVCESF